MTPKLPFDDWVIEAWIMRLGSFPTERIVHSDFNGGYEKREAHILRLENGKYATIIESGCSCYSPSFAEIQIHPNRRSAKDLFDKWVKENSR